MDRDHRSNPRPHGRTPFGRPDVDFRDASGEAEWHRDYAERRLAGVCAGVAARLGVPVTWVRAGFVVATLLPGLHFAGPLLYGALWLLMPDHPGGPSGLDRLLDGFQGLRAIHDDWQDSAPRARPRYERDDVEDELRS